MKKITFIISFLFLALFSYSQCNYTLEMHDSYGDGWGSSNSIDLTVDGVTTNYTLSSGFSSSVEFEVATGDDITTVFNCGGSYCGEASFRILDSSGNELVSNAGAGDGWGDAGPADVTTGTITANCPSCLPPTSLATANISTSSVDISWTSSETSFNIEVVDITSGETADGSIDYTSSTNSYPLTSLSANNEYEVYVQADCGAGETSSWVGPVSFTTLCAAIVPDYTADMSNNPVDNCWKEANNGDAASGPTDLGSGLWYSSNHNGILSNAINLWQNVRSDWIISPSFDLSSSAPSELNVYVALTENSTNGSNADLGSDDSVSLLMTVDGGTTWTSLQTWTQGNVPTDIGEQITYDLSTITGTVQFAFLGDEGDLDDSEDVYFHVSQFRVRETPSCLEVSGLTTANITSSSAVLSWTADASQSLFNVEVVDITNNESVTGTPTEFGVANPYTLTGLTANNEYEVYVQADCGGSDTSSWVGPVSFTTLCEAVTEFSENFDGVTSSTFPNCWGKIGSSGSVYLSTSYDNSAPNALYLYSSSTSNLAVVGMTPVSNLGAGTHRFTFNMRANFTSGGIVEIGYLTDGNDPDSFISLGNVVSNSISYESYSFTPPAGTYTNYPAMRHTGSPANSVSIDDVVWEEIPSCLAPSALTASNVTTDSADISWTSDESSFNVEVVDVTAGGTATGTATYSDVTSPYSLSGLDSNTEYEVYVQADCGADGTSSWVGPVSFTTAVTCGHIIYDSGGATGDYANNELLIVTAFPDTAGELVTFTFDSFATESGWDKIWVYDGPDTSSSVLIDGVSGSTIPNPVTSSHSTGALTFKFDSDGSSVDAGFQVTVSCAPPPSCTTPTALAIDNITDSSADVSWTAGDSETLWNIEVVDVTAGETADGSVDYTSSTNSYPLTGLSSNNEYEVYVQADCGVDGTSEWSVAASFTTDCAVFSQSYNHGFDADNNGIVADASCWAVINQGSTNGWSLSQDSTTGNVYWNLTYSSVQHSDWLISPTFTVTDNLTDAFAFDGWNGNPSWGNEVIDVLVYDTNLTLLGTLATDLSLPAESEDTNFVYDLSSYENQDIRIAFYSSTEFLSYSRIDNFQVDSYTSLGIQDNSISLFNYFPNPVNDVLTIKAQKDVDNITVYNMLGQVVIRQTPNTRDCTVNLSTMQTGAYFVQVSIDNSVETVRILKN